SVVSSLTVGMEITASTPGLLRPGTKITQLDGTAIGISPAAANGSIAFENVLFTASGMLEDSLMFRTTAMEDSLYTVPNSLQLLIREKITVPSFVSPNGDGKNDL